MQIQITFPDKRTSSFKKGITGLAIAHSISPQLAKRTFVFSLNDKIYDLNTPIHEDGNILFYSWNEEEGKSAFWHSSAHVMAEAIQYFFPETKFAIGPPIENGFYYDIDLGTYKLTDSDIIKIENKMLELAKGNHVFTRIAKSKQDAVAHFRNINDPYKLELLENLEDGNITFYQQNQFVDLCRGPHIPHTGFIKAAKIINIAGAYWRGDEKKPMLTRVYAISFQSQKELDDYMLAYEEAKKRDHRKIGKALQLFHFSENVGMGLPLWLPNGTIVRRELESLMSALQKKAGYQAVISPHIGHKNLYVTSGHYEKYGQDSFQPINTPREGEQFFLKPMNCPHHCEIYKSSPRSYRDLPVRLSEFGTVYRYEQHGELHGLTRVRGFTQDDAHLFCTSDQLKEEFIKVIDIVISVFSMVGLHDFTAQISLRDKEDKAKYIGSDENWEKAEKAIIEAAAEKKLKTQVVYGEAAFYGPKLDFMVKDALNRKWQLGTIQVDYNLPERFELEYTDVDNSIKRPVMIHRAPFGSFERFLAIILENFAGNLPLWLAPTQVSILPISDTFLPFAEQVKEKLDTLNFRVAIDKRAEKIGKKIRDAEVIKIPYMMIIGEKEQARNAVSLRKHQKGDLGMMSLSEVFQKLTTELENKQIT